MAVSLVSPYVSFSVPLCFCTLTVKAEIIDVRTPSEGLSKCFPKLLCREEAAQGAKMQLERGRHSGETGFLRQTKWQFDQHGLY